MRRRSLLLTSFFAVAFAAPVMGQQPQENSDPKPQPAGEKVSACPKLSVKSATPQFIREGATVIFAADIAGGDPNVTPTLLWSLSAGMIKADHGRNIEVDSTGAGGARQITADLWVGGYASECTTNASFTVRVVPPAKALDEFGELSPEQETERLSKAVAELSDQKDKLFVISYAGRSNPRGYAYTSLKRIIDQLAKLDVSADRVQPIDGGFREQPAVELWLVPQGAEAPKPTPTVDRKDIVYPKATPAVRKKT